MDDKKSKREQNTLDVKQTILGIVILIILLAASIFVLFIVVKYAVFGLVNGALSIIQEISKLEAVLIVAIITGFFSLVIACLNTFVSSSLTRKNERREYLAQKREEPYGEYIDMVYMISQNANGTSVYSQEDMIEDVAKFSRGITLWGSKKVARKWSKFKENSMKEGKEKENLFLMEEIMNDMRKDLGVQRTKKGDLLGFIVNDLKNFKK